MRATENCDDRISAASFQGTYLPGLLSITIYGASGMKDAFVRQIAAGCVHLVSIEMLNCPRLSLEVLAEVDRYCRDLTSLSISSCLGIEYRGIRAIIDGYPSTVN